MFQLPQTSLTVLYYIISITDKHVLLHNDSMNIETPNITLPFWEQYWFKLKNFTIYTYILICIKLNIKISNIIELLMTKFIIY